jgi:hypothetical protein
VEGPLAAALEAIEARLGRRPIKLNERFASYRLAAGEYRLDLAPLHPQGVSADLARRDFTVNAWAVPLGALGDRPEIEPAEAIVSLAGEDIASRTLRMIGRANLEDDPLRVLRNFRLLAARGCSWSRNKRALAAGPAPVRPPASVSTRSCCCGSARRATPRTLSGGRLTARPSGSCFPT